MAARRLRALVVGPADAGVGLVDDARIELDVHTQLPANWSEWDAAIIAFPTSTNATAIEAAHALADSVPVVLVVDAFDRDLATLAAKIGAQVTLRAYGDGPVREAIVHAGKLAAERRASAAALRASEQARTLVNVSVGDVVFLLRVEGERFRFAEINPSFTKATGLTEHDVVGKFVDDVIPEPSLSLVLARYREAVTEQCTVRWDEVTEYPTGTKYGEVSVTPVLDAEGVVIKLIGTVHDVTDVREREKTIRLYADVVRTVGIALSVWRVADPSDETSVTLVAANPEAERLSGGALSNATGGRYIDVFPSAEAREVARLLCEVARDGAVRELRALRSTLFPGRVFRMRAFALEGSVCLAADDVTTEERARALDAMEQHVLELVGAGTPLDAILATLVRTIEELTPMTKARVELGTTSHVESPWARPILGGDGRTLGVFELAPLEAHEPAREDLHLLARAAHVAGVAVRRHELDQQLRDLSAHLEAAREEERTGIAREIHDQLGQSLTAMHMDLAWILRRATSPTGITTEALVGKVNELSQLTRDTVDQVRRISSDLRPGVLDDIGLSAAIAWQASEFEKRTGIRCTVAPGGEDARTGADRDLSTAVFRVFQEALTNIVRHAEARHVEVALGERGGNLVLTVRDDGRGIRAEEVQSPRSLGLLGIRERARRLGGTATFMAAEPRGTIVTLALPLAT